MQEGRRTGNLLTAGQWLFRRTHEPLTPSGYGRDGTSRAFGWAERHARAQSLPTAVSAAPGVGRGCWTAARGRLSLTLACALLPSQPEEPSTWTSYVGKMFMAATNYLPTQVSDMMNQDRAFATGRLGFSGHRNICTLSTIQKLPRLLVASSSGHLYIYNLDPQDGGDCVLIKTHSLLGSGTADENKENDLRPSLPQSYAATVARPSPSAASTVPGYSEDGGALRGEVIPEHEFAAGPVCLDDENEFPPVSVGNP
ncbi:hypothetical protein J1605_023266 [Eschrichtius robustus]|uniref:WD repeat domain phosphoinositide-interacting protein 1 n=1 Tax=Eschrichtius robustus TaxID=9764 RepID=A0AB34H7G4_ESCRO|nr:hypothetical protein J1605_023266 [Eschrichtius robustus]